MLLFVWLLVFVGVGVFVYGRHRYRFNIINLEKKDSTYNHGMRPLMYCTFVDEMKVSGWQRVGDDICYFQNHFTKHAHGKLVVPVPSATGTATVPDGGNGGATELLGARSVSARLGAESSNSVASMGSVTDENGQPPTLMNLYVASCQPHNTFFFHLHPRMCITHAVAACCLRHGLVDGGGCVCVCVCSYPVCCRVCFARHRYTATFSVTFPADARGAFLAYCYPCVHFLCVCVPLYVSLSRSLSLDGGVLFPATTTRPGRGTTAFTVAVLPVVPMCRWQQDVVHYCTVGTVPHLLP